MRKLAPTFLAEVNSGTHWGAKEAPMLQCDVKGANNLRSQFASPFNPENSASVVTKSMPSDSREQNQTTKTTIKHSGCMRQKSTFSVMY